VAGPSGLENDFEQNSFCCGGSLPRVLSPIYHNRLVNYADDRVSPKDIITPDTLRNLLNQVRQQIDFEPSLPQARPHTFLSSFLPPTPSDELTVLAQDTLVVDTVTPDLRHLLDETSDILESPAAMRVFHILLDKSVEEFVQVLETETKASRDGVVRLANYLPVGTKEAEKIAHGVPNRYFQVQISEKGAYDRLWRRWRS